MTGKVISVINQKGGVGKSTITGALTTGLKLRGYKTLLVELDPQGNASFCFRAQIPKEGKDLLTYLLEGKPLKGLIQKTEQGDLIPSVPALAGADINLYRAYKDKPAQAYLLQNALQPLRSKYDYIFIDTPPALNKISFNSLVASTNAIIPAKPELYSLQAIGQLNTTIKRVKADYNPDLDITGILLIMAEAKTRLHKDVAENLEQVAGLLDTRIIKHPIRKSIGIADAQNNRTDIFSYRKPNGSRSLSAYDFSVVIDNLLELWKEG